MIADSQSLSHGITALTAAAMSSSRPTVMPLQKRISAPTKPDGLSREGRLVSTYAAAAALQTYRIQRVRCLLLEQAYEKD